jgi:hypothetical protein
MLHVGDPNRIQWHTKKGVASKAFVNEPWWVCQQFDTVEHPEKLH